MNAWIAFWSILKKDIKNYYLKPPNISWGIIFPLSWTLMQFIRTPSTQDIDIRSLLPGLMAMSILFGTTSMLAVTITFERKGRSFYRLLLAPISMTTLVHSFTRSFTEVEMFILKVLRRCCQCFLKLRTMYAMELSSIRGLLFITGV